MKTLKLNHALAQMVLNGTKTTTWRLHDDKDLSINDKVELVDKVYPTRKSSWQIIGLATIDAIINKRMGELDDKDEIGHEGYTSKEEMYDVFRGYYGKNIGPETLVKIVRFSFEPYLPPKPFQPETLYPTVVKELTLFGDGGSRGNPGPSASGFVLLDSKTEQLLEEGGEYLGITTNNQAEYHALKLGLERAQHYQPEKVNVYMDSQLVVNQLNGIYKVKNRDLQPVYQAIKELASTFKQISFSHVRREMNTDADRMVNKILDEHTSKP